MLLPSNIRQIKESVNPLSCHCFIIETENCTWVYDVGACDETAEKINLVTDTVNIVLSHFHADHISNVEKVRFDRLFVGSHTHKHTKCGEIVTKEQIFDGVKIFPLPNTHAKGSLGLEVGDFAFLGDAIFPAHVDGHHAYNATLLKDEIDTLSALSAVYFVLAHNDDFIYEKDDILHRLKFVYSKRKGNEPYINLD